MKIGRLFTALALSLAPLSLVAQESGVEVDYSHPVKYKVGGIKVEGNTFYSDQQIISLTGIQKGMEVTVPGEALSNVVERLWLQRYFEDVSLTIDSLNVAGDSAWFSIRIKERPRVSRWSFSGVTSGERKDIQERVNLRPGREFSEYVEKTTSDIIKRYFAEKGFLLCEVTAETVKDSIIRNAIRVNFNIDKGQKIKVKDINFIGNENVNPIYALPLLLHERGFDDFAVSRLSLDCGPCDLEGWTAAVERMERPKDRRLRIAICGKYVKLPDAYLSINEALYHAASWNDADLELVFVDTEEVEKIGPEQLLKDVDGILVPGGFGSRGIEGMIQCARFARENDVPYLGICLGMQIAVIEAARSLAGLKNANSREFDPEGDECVIDLMDEQRNIVAKGGTMRLGAYPCAIQRGTLLHSLYGQDTVQERHRHRYEVSPAFQDQIADSGIVFSGTSPDGKLVEAMENPSCRFFVAVQSHPEFKSRPNRVHPLFDGFIKAALH